MDNWNRSYSCTRFLRHVRNESLGVRILAVLVGTAYSALIGYCLYMGVQQ